MNEAALHRSRWSTLRARNWAVGKRTLKALALVTAIAEQGEGNKIMINQLSTPRVVFDIKPEGPERVNSTNLASHYITNPNLDVRITAEDRPYIVLCSA